MSSLSTGLLLTQPTAPSDECLETSLRNASDAGIAEVILLESVPPAGELPAQAGTLPAGLHLTRLRLAGADKLGSALKIGLSCALSRPIDLVAVWTGTQPPSVEALRTIVEPFRDSALCAAFSEEPTAIFAPGLRVYRADFLRRIPFSFNTNEDHFDSEIMLQMRATRSRFQVVEVPGAVPCSFATRNPLGHSLRTFGSTLRFHANRFALIYHPKFDFLRDSDRYIFKQEPSSLHQHVLQYPVRPNATVVELGAGQGHISRAFHDRGARVLAVDMTPPENPLPCPFLRCDLDDAFADTVIRQNGRADLVVMLDVVEHVAHPEKTMQEVWRILKPGGVLLASTANVAFFPLRFMLLAGLFNYGRRGILDLTHRRLFTYRSFRRLLIDSGFEPERWQGFGPPIADLIGRTPGLLAIDRTASAFAHAWIGLFAYQFLAQAIRQEGLDDVLANGER
jgi:2-polyprenyl-3-methyl-5-hydroxy-6-metoxy-1,4-benzoquinol methylase